MFSKKLYSKVLRIRASAYTFWREQNLSYSTLFLRSQMSTPSKMQYSHLRPNSNEVLPIFVWTWESFICIISVKYGWDLSYNSSQSKIPLLCAYGIKLELFQMQWHSSSTIDIPIPNRRIGRKRKIIGPKQAPNLTGKVPFHFKTQENLFLVGCFVLWIYCAGSIDLSHF